MRGTEFAEKEGIFITDSIGKNFRHLTRALSLSIPGATISKIKERIPNIPLEKYKVVLLLVGTNDLTPKSLWQWYKKTKLENKGKEITLPHHTTTPVDRIVEHYKLLLEVVKMKNPHIFIMASAILPRPFDFKQNKNYLIEVNKALEKLCKELNVYFVYSYKPLMKYGSPKENYFDCDGLHLSQDGSKVMQRFFLGQLSYVIKREKMST